MYILIYFYTTKRAMTTQLNNNKYNVLFILIDDLRPLTGEDIHLPNIEKLAANGIYFKNAFAQVR